MMQCMVACVIQWRMQAPFLEMFTPSTPPNLRSS